MKSYSVSVIGVFPSAISFVSLFPEKRGIKNRKKMKGDGINQLTIF
jgi:hypothetical protein